MPSSPRNCLKMATLHAAEDIDWSTVRVKIPLGYTQKHKIDMHACVPSRSPTKRPNTKPVAFGVLSAKKKKSDSPFLLKKKKKNRPGFDFCREPRIQ